MPAFVFHLALFNYDGKGTRDVGLTGRCHMSNIIPDIMPDIMPDVTPGSNVSGSCKNN